MGDRTSVKNPSWRFLDADVIVPCHFEMALLALIVAALAAWPSATLAGFACGIALSACGVSVFRAPRAFFVLLFLAVVIGVIAHAALV